MRAGLLAAAALGGAVLGGVGVLALGRASAGDGVRAYLLEHPEVILEATERLRSRETARAVAAAGRAVAKPYAGAYAGNPDGDVTLVEYYDYNCGLCRSNVRAVDELVRRDPKLLVVYREMPVLAPSSRDAARASLAAARGGSERFNRFHRTLYAGGHVGPGTLAAAARAAGVAVPAEDPAADREIDTNLRTAAGLGITGVPSFVVGDRVLVGVRSLEQLEAAVKAARGR